MHHVAPPEIFYSIAALTTALLVGLVVGLFIGRRGRQVDQRGFVWPEEDRR
jgi:ABC-type dipeptide/oligopeptide/nickel transport system permease subunit